jgi:hypothetical protein
VFFKPKKVLVEQKFKFASAYQLKKAERGHTPNLVERDIHDNVLNNAFYELNLVEQ